MFILKQSYTSKTNDDWPQICIGMHPTKQEINIIFTLNKKYFKVDQGI